ncbi:3-oxoacyl-(acyl-carrier-protein) synthase III family protein, putative [Eimeria maxima]|uniref:3-oxoacyl-(Acyl-carrier-protein) synthase III family protein, putative n=1 Tax=Eimeria maxima TaxID=5804 RepID=U6MA96_EIMMA|nr:3-oxoacyl-(acyl-carrier-protein) synthase III family protein, putative [Eimeria maxima]CDJ58550.1 3-oxoacyl-(acyl-carrier-protein) synthase III family protein, putative [Eimeria maxima]
MYITSAGSPYRRVLLVGSDALSRWLDWRDRNTCILFGDAAGAAVLTAQDAAPPLAAPAAPGAAAGGGAAAAGSGDAAAGGEGEEEKPLGLLSYVIHSDGHEQKQIQLNYSGTDNPLPLRGAQNKHLCLSKGCFSPLTMNGREVFKFVSKKIPIALEDALRAAKVTSNDIDWLLIHQANKRIIDAVADRLNIPKEKVEAGKVKKGDLIAMAGFGAGLTWAAAVLRYG